MTTKAGRQPPKWPTTNSTSAGATAAPIDEPLSNSATAQPRSRRGNHSETAFVAPGQFAASPAPSRKRKPQKLAQARGEGRQHRDARVPQDGEREAVARADAVEHAAGHGLHHRVGDAERDDDQGEVLVRPVELGLERRPENAQRLPVEVVDDRRGEEQAADPPAVAADAARTGAERRGGRAGRGRRAHGCRRRSSASASASVGCAAVPPRPSVLSAPQAAPSRRHSSIGARRRATGGGSRR